MAGRDYEEVLREVLLRVRPTEEEQKEIKRVADHVLSTIRSYRGKFVDVVLAGSAARGTNLRGSSDIDVFVLYPPSVPKEEMEAEVLRIGQSIGEKYELRYAEHPYITIWVDGVEIDVVPAYSIKPGQKIISATDRTPLHQRYLEGKLSERQKDEVRILKAFLKGIGVYGAEISAQGFSGYLCELLVLYYGSFLDLLRAASRWKPQVVIDIEGHAARRFDEPLVVVDPVDPYRNVAAPVSLNSLAVFVAAAREFLRDPALTFFFPEDAPLPPDSLKATMEQRRTAYLFVVTDYPAGVSADIVWGEIKALAKKISTSLERKGYAVMNAAAWTDESKRIVLLFEIPSEYFAMVEKHCGPPVFDYENSERFLEKHREDFFGPYIENGRWCVDVYRQYSSPEVALYHTIEELRAQGAVQRDVDVSLSKGYEILRGRAILPLYSSDRAFARWFSNFVVRRPFWLKR